LSCCNIDKHESISIIFGRNVTENVGNQKALYFPASPKIVLLYYLANAGAQKKSRLFTQMLYYRIARLQHAVDGLIYSLVLLTTDLYMVLYDFLNLVVGGVKLWTVTGS